MCTVAVSHHDSLCYMKDSAHAACGGGRHTSTRGGIDTHSQSSSNLIILLGSIFTFELFLLLPGLSVRSLTDRPPTVCFFDVSLMDCIYII